MIGPRSQKPWHPVLFRSTESCRPARARALPNAASTAGAPAAVQPLPAQTVRQGRPGSRAARQAALCTSSSWKVCSLGIVALGRLTGCLCRFLPAILPEQARHFGLGQVRMRARIHPHHRSQPATPDAADGAECEFEVLRGTRRSHLQLAQQAVEHARRSSHMTGGAEAYLHQVPAYGLEAEAVVESGDVEDLAQR